MGKNIQIKKTVYQKDDYNKVIDRSFSSFKQEVPEAVEKTVEQFFADYEELYLEIPVQGEEQSHEYLSLRSGELISVNEIESDIQPLLDEIAELRQQLLDAQNEILDQRLEIANLIAAQTGEGS